MTVAAQETALCGPPVQAASDHTSVIAFKNSLHLHCYSWRRLTDASFLLANAPASWETIYGQRLACSIDTGWRQTNVGMPFFSTCAFHLALLDSMIFCNWQWPYLPSVVLWVAVCSRTWGKQTHRLEVLPFLTGYPKSSWCIFSSGECTVNLLCQEHGASWETIYGQRLACSIETGWRQTNVGMPFYSTCAFHLALLDSMTFWYSAIGSGLPSVVISRGPNRIIQAVENASTKFRLMAGNLHHPGSKSWKTIATLSS